MSQPRRSKHITVISKPSMESESESKKAMRKAIKQQKEIAKKEREDIMQQIEQERRANPLLFDEESRGYNQLQFVYDGWASQHYEPNPRDNEQYDLIRVRISRDEHHGYCSDAEDFTVYEDYINLHFRKDKYDDALLEGIPPIVMKWDEPNPDHCWCHARIRYQILSMNVVCYAGYSSPHDYCSCEDCNKVSQEPKYEDQENPSEK